MLRSQADRSRLGALLALLLTFGCATAAPAEHVETSSRIVARYGRLDLTFDVPDRTLAADDVKISARFITPAGQTLVVGGFPVGDRFQVRFSPKELGEYVYSVRADGGEGEQEVARGRFTTVAGSDPGYVHVSRAEPHQLAREDGSAFLPLGENRINVWDPTWNYGHMSAPDYLAYMGRNGMNTLRIFLFADCENEEAPDHVQQGCLEPHVGRFDQRAADRFDEILQAAEQNGIYVVFTLFAIGFTQHETWKSWDDNPYNAKLGGPAPSVDAFFKDPKARAAAKRRLDYVLARWGYSTHFLAIDLLNEPEWDGPVGERTWIPWAEDLAARWKQTDPYQHLVTAGPVGLLWNVDGDERPWYGDARDDVVQWHLYGKEFYEPHALADEVVRKTDEVWSFGKPVWCGEFAYGGEDKTTYDHTHVGIWSMVMGGVGALAHSAPPFTLDSDEPMTPERGRHFRTLSKFLARLDWRRPLVPLGRAEDVGHGLKLWSLGRDDFRALWLLAPREGYGTPLPGAAVDVQGLVPGEYKVEWLDDVSGEPLGSTTARTDGRTLHAQAPSFNRHVAAIVSPAGPPPSARRNPAWSAPALSSRP